MIVEGITISEIMEKTGKTRHAVEAWLSRHNVNPIIGEFLYPSETLDKIKEAKRGRPSKPKEDE
jgi:hypothetical protein